MKSLLASLICIAGLSIAQAAGVQQISLEDILLLAERGISDETVMVFLKTREIGFTPVAEDIDKLLASGVSQEAIRYILWQTATYSSPSYSYRTTTYIDRYPPYYYTPYYSGTSVYFSYSSYPHTWYGNHYGGVHYTSLNHGVAHNPGYNDHRTLSHSVYNGGHARVHISQQGLGHNVVPGIRHRGAPSTGGISRQRTGSPVHVGRKKAIHRSRHKAAHSSRHSMGHSTRSTAHRGGHGGGGHGGGH